MTKPQVFDTVCFIWNYGNCELVLHDRTIEQAEQVARDMGYTPRVWYKPSTWQNIRRAYRY